MHAPQAPLCRLKDAAQSVQALPEVHVSQLDEQPTHTPLTGAVFAGQVVTGDD